MKFRWSCVAKHECFQPQTPRRNMFFFFFFFFIHLQTSFFNYIEIYNKNDRIYRNFSYLKNKTVNFMKSFNIEQMQNMCFFYETTINHCNCSNNKFSSSAYCSDIPCIHRLQIAISRTYIS